MKPDIDRQLLFMARNGALEMLQHRGYKLPPNEGPISEEEVERRMKENVPGLLDIYLENGDEKVYVWFAEYNGTRNRSVNLALLRDIVADIQKRCPDSPNLRMIVVLRDDERVVRGLEDHMKSDVTTFRGRVELFRQRDILMPVASHVLQPDFHLLSTEQRDDLKRIFHIDTARKDMGRFRDHDKLARYLGYPKNAIIRILRPDGTAYYRFVE